MTTEIKAGQRWRTRGGLEAVIESTEGRAGFAMFPVSGVLGDGVHANWLASGKYARSGSPHPYDLVMLIAPPGTPEPQPARLRVLPRAAAPKAEPETVAALRELVDRIASGEVTEFALVYCDPARDEYTSIRFGSPRDLLVLATIFHEQAVRNLMTGTPA